MKVWYSPYQLRPIIPPNSQAKSRYRLGALLRVRLDNGSVGYADLCPFSDMGDSPLELELRQMRQGKPSSQAERSLYFASKDAQARAESRSLYSPIKIKNHFLITDVVNFDLTRVEKLILSGYTEFKIKMGRDLVKESTATQQLAVRLGAHGKLRLDFNAILSRDRFVEWFEKNQNWLRPKLEFTEDPFPYDPKEWRTISEKYGLSFALDLAASPLSVTAEGAQVIVIKPAIQNELKIIQKFRETNKKFVITHYMDFPVGQMCAFVSAQEVFSLLGPRLLSCGLQQHDLYDGQSFQNLIRHDGPFILPPEGWGLGFDSLLQNLNWTEL
jgi:O-succinylbenzoate synthase